MSSHPLEESSLFTRKRYRLIAASLLAFVCGGGYAAISIFNMARVRFHPMNPIQCSRWDRQIPFVPGWVWVYLLYYPFCFLPLLLPEVREDARLFKKTVAAYALQFGIGFTFFLTWPLRMEHLSLAAGLQGRLLNQLYACDLGFNSFPSLHLANIVFVSLLFWQVRGRSWGIGVSIVASLIAASTLLIKQHFISDVLAGAILGCVSFVVSDHFVSPESSFRSRARAFRLLRSV